MIRIIRIVIVKFGITNVLLVADYMGTLPAAEEHLPPKQCNIVCATCLNQFTI